MRVKKVLKRELASNRKYKTTYKDIKKYFKVLNKALFKNIFDLRHRDDILDINQQAYNNLLTLILTFSNQSNFQDLLGLGRWRDSRGRWMW